MQRRVIEIDDALYIRLFSPNKMRPLDHIALAESARKSVPLEVLQNEPLIDIIDIINANLVSPEYTVDGIIEYLEGKGFKV